MLASFIFVACLDAADSTEDEPWAQLTSKLSSPDYKIRQSVTESLRDGRESAFDAVLKMTQKSGEASARAIEILDYWAFETDGSFAEQCERALMDATEKPISEAASLSESMLNAARDVRQIRAVRALRDHNADVRVPSRVMMFERGPTELELADGTPVPTTLEDGPIIKPIGMIAIFPSWTGGIDGLWQLQRLRHQTKLHIRIANGDLPDAEVEAIASDLQDSRIDFVGASLGMKSDGGTPLIVAQVFQGSAAERAGLRAGDEILDFDGEKVSQIYDLITLLRKYKPGNHGVLHYRRGKDIHEVDVTLQGWEKMPALDEDVMQQWQLQQRLRQRQLLPPPQ